ncbi:hypothetical protein B0H13DRAFT_1895611 [Mycena leptocephala]|nr:hypothetical protein B0H13DRAFT_1895611 [Mycena leptocephala]
MSYALSILQTACKASTLSRNSFSSPFSAHRTCGWAHGSANAPPTVWYLPEPAAAAALAREGRSIASLIHAVIFLTMALGIRTKVNREREFSAVSTAAKVPGVSRLSTALVETSFVINSCNTPILSQLPNSV